jgi:hypothetical protein
VHKEKVSHDGDRYCDKQRARRSDHHDRQEANSFTTDHPDEYRQCDGDRSVNGSQVTPKNGAKAFSFLNTWIDFLTVAVVPALLATPSAALDLAIFCTAAAPFAGSTTWKHACLREFFATRFVPSSLIYWIVHSFPSTS